MHGNAPDVCLIELNNGICQPTGRLFREVTGRSSGGDRDSPIFLNQFSQIGPGGCRMVHDVQDGLADRRAVVRSGVKRRRFDYQHLSHSAERWYGSAAMTMYDDCALPLQDSDACCPPRMALVCRSEVGS